MAETTAKAQPTTAQTGAVSDARTRDDREYQTVSVVEVTVVRPVEAGADHGSAADQAAADLAGVTPDGFEETGRRVKTVQVRPV
jgi:hypothetical protein